MKIDEKLDHFPRQKEITLPGVHNDLIESVLRICPLSGWKSILDIGAGEGALCARLKSKGYRVEALEIVEGRFSVPEVRCYKLDLNSRFSEEIDKKFDVLIANHVIEHLENPRFFLRQCKKLLAQRGRIFIASPNLESWSSRLVFIRYGYFPLFDRKKYLDLGHITPFFTWQMDQICREESLVVLERRPIALGLDAETASTSIRNWFKFFIKKALYKILQPMIKGPIHGPSTMFILAKRNDFNAGIESEGP